MDKEIQTTLNEDIKDLAERIEYIFSHHHKQDDRAAVERLLEDFANRVARKERETFSTNECRRTFEKRVSKMKSGMSVIRDGNGYADLNTQKFWVCWQDAWESITGDALNGR